MGAIAEVGAKVIEGITGAGGKDAASSLPVDALMQGLLGSGLKTLETPPSASSDS
ncbi:hypothetical protein [Burkholderia stabilis]|uniref:hypothetical protein n=1 Tax=Burkholderia stabilis TaxID=95485 RepID=UPI0013E93B8F|nr:hypothetical protein [Burkholderia stabilis]